MLALRLCFGWKTFLEDGFVEMAQVRYFGVWPEVALGLVLLWRSLAPRGARLPAAIVKAALLLVSSMAWLGLVLRARGRASVG